MAAKRVRFKSVNLTHWNKANEQYLFGLDTHIIFVAEHHLLYGELSQLKARGYKAGWKMIFTAAVAASRRSWWQSNTGLTFRWSENLRIFTYNRCKLTALGL